MLEHSQLAILLTGKNNPLWICSVPDRARAVLGCSTGAVYLSKESATHILTDHNDISTFELLILPVAIQNGRIMREKDNNRFLGSFYTDKESQKIFYVSMKVVGGGHELWVSSMYKLTPAKLTKKLRRHTDI